MSPSCHIGADLSNPDGASTVRDGRQRAPAENTALAARHPAARALCTSSSAQLARRDGSQGGTGDPVHDSLGTMGHPLTGEPVMGLHAPASPGRVERVTDRLRDALRPSWTAGRAYRQAEQQAQADLASQLADGVDGPTVEAMWAPEGEDAVLDPQTSPRPVQHSATPGHCPAG